MKAASLADPFAERLRDAYLEAESCSPPERFHRAAIGELPAAEREQLAEHAFGCPACAVERDLAARFEAPPSASGRADVAFIVGRLEGAAPWRGRPATR
jgi:anti-sigma factor RsiW